MTLQPLFDYVLIEPLEDEEKTPSGLYIPDTAKEKPQKGKILAIGEGKKDENGKVIPVSLKINDVVIYKKWGGNEVKVEGKELLLVREEDILAVIK